MKLARYAASMKSEVKSVHHERAVGHARRLHRRAKRAMALRASETESSWELSKSDEVRWKLSRDFRELLDEWEVPLDILAAELDAPLLDEALVWNGCIHQQSALVLAAWLNRSQDLETLRQLIRIGNGRVNTRALVWIRRRTTNAWWAEHGEGLLTAVMVGTVSTFPGSSMLEYRRDLAASFVADQRAEDVTRKVPSDPELLERLLRVLGRGARGGAESRDGPAGL